MNVAVNQGNFNGLVSESLKTTSRIISDVFEKRHDNVQRDIRNLMKENPTWGSLNFEETPYVDPQNGQTYQMYEMTRDGYSMLVMGFTGRKAMEWKIKFLEAFSAMEQRLKNAVGFQIPQTLPDALRLAAEQAEEIEIMKPKVVAMERLEASEGSQLPSVVAKVLGMPQNRFFRELHAKNWTYKRGKVWVGYEDKVKRGYLENDTSTFMDQYTGEERTKVQLKVTPKGMARLAQIFGKGGVA